MSIDEIMGKVKDGAAAAADVTSQVLASTKHFVDKSVAVGSLTAKINRLKSSINNEYMAIGKLVYETHLDPRAPQDGIDSMLEHITDLNRELEETVAERDRRKAE